MDDRLSVERIWYSNTLLLGFDAALNEKKHRVHFSHDMFKNPNVKGMDVVLHFLFSQLYPTRINELLKFVWPINDLAQGKQYRQIIANLLEELKDKLDLPPIVSTLQSCFGKRCYDLLWKVSYYVLQTAMQKNFSGYAMPTLPTVDATTSMQKLQDLATVIKLHITRQSRMFVSHAQRSVAAQESWRQFDKMMYDDHTALTEELAFLKKEIAELASKVDLSRVNDAGAQETRQKRIDDIRKMWQVAEEFNTHATSDKEAYADILAGNAYPHILSASDLRIDKIPEELAGVAAPLLLPTTDDTQAPQFTFDGLITLFNSALSLLSHSLPPASPPLPICTEAPKLAEWSKAQTLQLAAIEAFEAELTHQVVSLRKELQEAMEVRASIDSALHNRAEDERFRMQPLPPPASYLDDRAMHEKRELTAKELGFSSPASRAPKQDVLEKLANSVKRVALRGSRTFAAIANELLPPDFGSEDSQNFSFSTMSTLDPDTLFAPPATPAHNTVQQSGTTSKRRVPATNQRQSIMNAPLYNKPPQPTPSSTVRQPTKKPVPKPYTSSIKQPIATPYATSNDSSALNLSSIFTQQKSDIPTSTKSKPISTRSIRPPTTTTTTTTTSTSSSPPNPSATKKATHKRAAATKPRPSAMEILVNDLAEYIGGSELGANDETYDTASTDSTASKPKPSGFRTGPATGHKTPKKKLAWAPDDLHSYTNTLDAMGGTAFMTNKQLPRTPLPHERTAKQTTTPNVNSQPEDTNPLNDTEWDKLISKHNSPTKTSPYNSSPSTFLPYTNGNLTTTSPQKTTPKTRHEEPMDSMDYDTGSIESPMHMTEWLSSTSAPLDDENEADTLFPTFSTNLSFSNDQPKDFKPMTPQKNSTHSIFTTPADDHWEFR